MASALGSAGSNIGPRLLIANGQFMGFYWHHLRARVLIELGWCSLIDVRYAPIATEFCMAEKFRDVPMGDMASYRLRKA